MPNLEPFELVVGEARIYLAPANSAKPDVDTVPGASWTDLGETDENGVTLNHIRETQKIRTGGSVMTKKVVLTAADEEISFSLAETTPEKLAAILDDVTVTDVAAAAGTPGYKTFDIEPAMNQFALLVRGPSPEGDYDCQWYFPYVSPTEAGEMAYKLNALSVLPCKFTALEDPANPGQYGVYEAQDATAV